MKKNFPYYLLLLPVFYLLHSYNQLFGFIPFGMIAGFFLKAVLFGGAIFGVAYFFTKSISKAAVIVFFLLLFTIYFGPWHDFIKNITANAVVSSYKVIIPVSFILLVLLCRFFIKRPALLKKFTSFMGILLILLCVTEVVLAIFNLNRYLHDHNLVSPGKPLCNEYQSCNLPDSSKPDIYFLVLDEYTSNKALMDLWNFDNSPFTGYLAEKGFHILPDGISNYNFTPYSMSAALNMRYLDKEKGSAELTSQLVSQSVKSVSDNETFCMLLKENYTIRFLAPLKSHIEDIGLIHEFGSYPQKQLYSQTLPGKIQRDIAWNFSSWFAFLEKWGITGSDNTYNYFYKRTQDALLTVKKIKETANATENRQPQFVLGHLLVTHKPHLYDSTGRMRTVEDVLTNNNLFNSYTQQIQYCNRLVKEVVDHILANNRKNTIIVIAGDHGFRELPLRQSKYYFDCLNAFYFPDGDYSSLYDNMSSVNIFRKIFNHSFCQHFPMLKDSTIMVKFRGGQPVVPK